jgi:hypothetical protein
MEIDFGEEVMGEVGPIPPGPPQIIKLEFKGRKAIITIALPTKDANGNPLVSPLTHVTVYYRKSSFAGSSPKAEVAAGRAMMVNAPATTNPVILEIDNLEYSTTYWFAATVSN